MIIQKAFKWALLSLLFLITIPSQQLSAQRNYDIHWVQFNSKAATPYSVFRPHEYLSPRAIERRARWAIKIDSLDLPVDPSFIKIIKDKGFAIHLVSKWMNGVAVVGTPEEVAKLKQLDFVTAVKAIGFSREGGKGTNYIGRRDYMTNYSKHEDFYGDSRNQIKMLNGHYLHRMGFRGEGVWVAVCDGGFTDMRETPAFDSLYIKKQILGTRDFVQEDDYVYEGSDHGRDVLSTMAANLPYLFVGTSPDASYFLFKTEDDVAEYVIEEYNWLAAVEYADSLGVEVVNSSLGYYDYDDNTMDYGYVDFDGNTILITRAADAAASRGMLIVTSAGNEGSGKWKYISAPGDADSVLTVGAVDRDGYHAKFSSYGFEKKPNIKPNVMARGHMAVVAAVGKYDTRYQFGTSFSSPIMAGLATSLWQALPHMSNMELIRALEKHSDRYQKPNNQYGYGVPNAYTLYKEHSNGAVIEVDKIKKYHYHPYNAKMRRVDFFREGSNNAASEIFLYNALGELLFESKAGLGPQQVWYAGIPDWDKYPAGVYTVCIKLGKETKQVLLVK